jgi:glycosyltransferase involved in cell wall biosynthesis
MTASKGTIIHLIVGLDPGGAEHALLHLATEQKKQGWHPEVFYLKSAASQLRHRFETAGIPVHNALSSPWLIKTLRDRYKDDPRFLLHSHLLYADCVAWFLKGLLGCPWVATLHSTYAFHTQRKARQALAQRIYQRLDQAIAVTETVGQSFVTAGALTSYRVIGNVIDPNFFQCTPKPTDSARKKLLLLGRLSPEKRFSLALNALSQLPAAFTLEVAGEGPEHASLRTQASTLNISNRVHFHGLVENPIGLMAQSDLVLLPSATEGLPLVALESIATGTPIIANAVGGLVTLLETSPIPSLPISTGGELAQEINRAFSTPDCIPQWQQWAQRIRQDFKPEVIGREVTQCYADVLG